ncbi:MAG: ABC transporter ATP-binding protein [Pseudobdellovibrionaceae bacterium]
MNSPLKKLFAELRPFRKQIIIILVAGVILSITTTRIIQVSKELFDAIEVRNSDALIKGSWTILALAFVASIARYYHRFPSNYVGDQVAVLLRQKMQAKFLKLNLTFHNNFVSGSGGLLSRSLNDISTIQNGLNMMADFASEPILMIGLISLMFYANWKLAAMVFIAFPLILLFLRSTARSLRKYSRQGQTELDTLTGTVKESLDGLRVIQSFGLEKVMEERFSKTAQTYLKFRRKVHMRGEASGPVTELVVTFIIVLIFGYLGVEISKGNATFGDMIMFVGSLLGLQKPVKKLQESYVKLQQTMISAERVFSLLADTSEVVEAPDAVDFPKNWKKIEYKNVSFGYKNKLVLKNFNLTLHRGEVIALVGESGSGKSTAVNLLQRFFEPTSGQILIDDTPLSKIKLKDLRKNLALVTQDVFLFNDSVAFNIHSGDFEKSPELIEKAAKSANAHDFICETHDGYQSRAGDRGTLFSGGEKQRISIARAILKDAPLLILDEATSALDSASEKEVQEGLEHLMEGRTALVIAHRLSTITKADKIIVMRDGEIVESGTHQSLVDLKGEYFRFRSLQTT